MKCHRTLSFGYRYENGQVVIDPNEAHIVRDIFKQYIAGASYLMLARWLSGGGVPYHADTSIWNKNMVKRVLENRRYLGEDRLPPLVDAKTFSQAATVRSGKNTGYANAPDFSEALRGKLTCGVCGGKMRRDTRMGFTRWRCAHAGATDVPTAPPLAVAEDTLLRRIQATLNRHIADPSLITIPPVEISVGGATSLRLRNDLQRELEKRDCDEAEAVRMIMACAAGRYAASDDGGAAREATRLKKRFAAAKPQNGFDIGLFKDTVHTVAIHPDGHFSIALTTGQHISPVG